MYHHKHTSLAFRNLHGRCPEPERPIFRAAYELLIIELEVPDVEGMAAERVELPVQRTHVPQVDLGVLSCARESHRIELDGLDTGGSVGNKDLWLVRRAGVINAEVPIFSTSNKGVGLLVETINVVGVRQHFEQLQGLQVPHLYSAVLAGGEETIICDVEGYFPYVALVRFVLAGQCQRGIAPLLALIVPLPHA